VFYDPTHIIHYPCKNTHILKDLLWIPPLARRPLLPLNPFRLVIPSAKPTHVVKYHRNATFNIAPYNMLLANASQTVKVVVRRQHLDRLPDVAVLLQVVSTRRRVYCFRSSPRSMFPYHSVSRLLDPCCQDDSNTNKPSCEDGCCPGPSPPCNLDTPSVECHQGTKRFSYVNIQVSKSFTCSLFGHRRRRRLLLRLYPEKPFRMWTK
jgi:hypothetical protein